LNLMFLSCCQEENGRPLPSEKVVCSVAITGFVDSSVPSNPKTQAAKLALLVHNSLRPTEAAVLVVGSKGCHQSVLLAAVPLCTTIKISCTSSSSSSSPRSDGAEFILNLDEDPASPQPGVGDSSTPTSKGTPASRFARKLKQHVATAQRHVYTFPSNYGNHEWVLSYGVNLLPQALHCPFDDSAQFPARKPSMIFGDIHLRTVLKRNTRCDWSEVQAILEDQGARFCRQVPVRLLSITLNCGGQMPPSDNKVLNCFFEDHDVEGFGQEGGTGESGGHSADIIIVALQESCPLALALDVTDNTSLRYHTRWAAAVTATLLPFGSFECVADNRLAGLQLLVMARSTLTDKITDIRTSCVRCGTLGTGSKGAVGVSFNLFCTSMCVVNMHLPAGETSEKARERAAAFEHIIASMQLSTSEGSKPRISDVHDNAIGNDQKAGGAAGNHEDSSSRNGHTNADNNQNNINGNNVPSSNDTNSNEAIINKSKYGRIADKEFARNIFQHDLVICAGDLNMRLWQDGSLTAPLSRGSTFAAASDPSCEWADFLAAHDELHLLRKREAVVASFHEAPVSFPPTYKFKIKFDNAAPRTDRSFSKQGSMSLDAYDTKREPAFCDRILWRARATVQVAPLAYESISTVTFTDHRPVRQDMQVVVNEILWDVLEELTQSTYRERCDSGEQRGRHESGDVLEELDQRSSKSGCIRSECCVL